TPVGGTVVVCKGTYTMSGQHITAGQPFVRLGKALTLRGQGLPLLDARGSTPGAGAIVGVLITHSNVAVTGVKVIGAVNEGIVAEPFAAWKAGAFETPSSPVAPITGVRVSHNVVNNDNK